MVESRGPLGHEGPKVSLRGASKAAETSQSILESAKAQRNARHLARLLPKSALKIQRTWRGCTTRKALYDHWKHTWIQSYGPSVADPQALVPAQRLLDHALPLLLLAHLPPASSRHRTALQQGKGLFIEGSSTALRGGLALLLRSLSTQSAEHNYLYLAEQPTARISMVSHLQRVFLLCSAIQDAQHPQHSATASGTANDTLAQVAASRIISLLCNSALWPSSIFHPSKESVSNGGSISDSPPSAESKNILERAVTDEPLIIMVTLPAEAVMHQVLTEQQQRGIIAAAARRVGLNLSMNNPSSSSSNSNNSNTGESTIKDGAAAVIKQKTTILQNLMLSQLRLCQFKHLSSSRFSPVNASDTSTTTSTANCMGGTTTSMCSGPGAAVKHLVVEILTVPGLVSNWVAQPVLKQLAQQETFLSITTAIPFLANELTLDRALCLLANLASLVAASNELQHHDVSKTKHPTTKNEKSSQFDIVQSIEVSALEAFTQSAQALCLRCLQLQTSMPSPSGPPQLQRDSLRAVSDAASIFGDGKLAVRLLEALSLEAFCGLYRSLLQLSDVAAGAAMAPPPMNNHSNRQQDSLRLLSALAFATNLLPLLWKQLALDIGLPLEIPLNASRWQVPSLLAGAGGLTLHQAQTFALFCRVYLTYLAIADNGDFYEQQTMFTIPQQRAIAASLNTLVFKTHVPDEGALIKSQQQQRQNGKPLPFSTLDPLLVQYAPKLLRALFERDARKRFCPPALWLEPYRTAVAGGKCDVSGAAVLRALLQRQGHLHGCEDDTDDNSDKIRSSNRARSSSGRPAQSSGLPVPPRTVPGGGEAGGLAELLLQAPQCIPFEERVAVFRGLVDLDKEARRLHLPPIEGGPRPLRLLIRRTHLLEDTLSQLLPAGPAIQGPLSITFINAQGLEEAGIDMGGLTKELLEAVASAVFHPDRGLFTAAAAGEGALCPHPLAMSQPQGTDLLCLAGVILGRAMYDGVLLNAPLAPFFLAALQGRLPTLDDLAALDADVHRGLLAVKHYQGNAEDLGLDFTVESDVFGARITEELIPGGSQIPVTNANKLQFVHFLADWHLRQRVGPAAAAFSRGLSRVIPPPWLRLFSPREVNQLLGGGEGASIDVSDMKKHTQYAGGYSSTSRTVQLFWKVLATMSPAERSAVLKFATSTGRAPLGGFAYLNPPFTIHKVDCGVSPLAVLWGPDVERLPSASTCSNTLKLPNYKREATLREKLLYAAKSGAGFELS